MQTRCPHCRTLFGVSTEQLKTFSGRVRCGNCRQVFNAFDSLNQPVVDTQRIPALQRRPTPFLRDINPRLEINFGDSAEPGPESIVCLDIDDEELEALNAQTTELNEPHLDFEDSITPENFADFEKLAQKTSIFLDPPVDLPSTQIFQNPQDEKSKEELQVQIELAPSIAPDNIEMEDIPPKTIAPDDFVFDDFSPAENAAQSEDDIAPSLLESKITALEMEFEKEDKEWRKKARERRRAEKAGQKIEEEQNAADLPPDTTDVVLKEEPPNNSEINQTDDENLALATAKEEAEESPAELSEAAQTEHPSLAANDEEHHDDALLPPLPEDIESKALLRPRQKISKDMVAVIVLAIIFVLQAFVLLRDGIVKSAPSMRSVYAAMGLSLPLQKEVSFLTIESSDLNIDNANGIFKLQATLGNHARFNQAWPNLELVLTDSLDQAIVRRVLRPKEYLKDPNLPSFKAQSEDHIQLWLEAKNVEAVGYRLSVFYPKEGTT